MFVNLLFLQTKYLNFFMKTKLFLCCTLVFVSSITLFAKVEHLLPKPHQITVTNNTFSLNQSIQLIVPATGTNDPAISAELTNIITNNGGTIVTSGTATIEIQLVASVTGAEFQNEAYSLEVTTNKITIKAVKLQGAYWAVQTLWQLAENAGGALETCTITDWPMFRIRGYMHDIGRSYIQFDLLKKHIEKLSRYKINVFHWHLTDNQGWRLESKIYPQLNAASSYTRQPGQYYTIAQAKELVTFANQHGVTIIPEIDMPGHSQAFRTALGHSMLTDAGLNEMKNIMTEACTTFSETPWMHIGSDEVRAEDTQGATLTAAQFISAMSAHIRSLGKKIVVWNPGNGYTEADIDMAQMWSSSGKPVGSLPAIDSRYYYINHFDQFADIVGIYNSNIAAREKGSDQYAGVIIGIWNDRIMPNDQEIVNQNAFYASMLAIAERSWMGGGGAYLPQKGVMLDPTDTLFSNWERRFLFQKANFLKDEPISYVKQTNIRWRITDQFPNKGNVTTVFPPENTIPASTYTYNGTAYNTRIAVGAGIYLRHTWGTIIPAFYSIPQTNSTAYAYTYVYSPATQTVGAFIEFQNYGRSESDLPAPQGQWDYNQSKIWINDTIINPPVWENTQTLRSNEITLKNENFTARPPVAVTLNEGWNKVLIKLPVGAFSLSQIRLVKWMFTCVFVTPDGKNAVEGLIYSPDKIISSSLEQLIMAIDKANEQKRAVQQGTEPGKYLPDIVNSFTNQIATANNIRNTAGLTEEQYKAAAETLINQTNTFKLSINYPKVSTESKIYWYSLSTPLRSNSGFNFVSFKGSGAAIAGEIFTANTPKFQWKITQNADGSYNIISKESATSYISPGSIYNTALKAQSGILSSGGWSFNPVYSNNYFAIVSNDVQFNQTTFSPYPVYNWGGGNNLTDPGCQYLIRTEEIIGADAMDSLVMTISEVLSFKSSISVGNEPGQYTEETISLLNEAINQAGIVRNDSTSSPENLRNAKSTLLSEFQIFKNSINLPIASSANKDVWYSLTSERGPKAIAFQSANAQLAGEIFIPDMDKFLWKLVTLTDGSYSLVNKTSGTYIAPEPSGSPAKLFAYSGIQTSGGWRFTPTYNDFYFIITSGPTTQINQGNISPYPLYNWGYNSTTNPGGFNMTDTGCKYIINTQQIVTSDLQTHVADPIKIWIENRFLKCSENPNNIKVFSPAGQLLNVNSQLPSGIIFVKTIYSVQKLIVK